jgi:tRNA-Thr(GGU) m(6)t(6)A37 methyltransferase TsaA
MGYFQTMNHNPEDGPSSQGYRFASIGTIHSPFRQPAGTPIQPSRASGATGVVRVEAPFQQGLRDLEGFERIWLVYYFYFHEAPPGQLLVRPFLDTTSRGVFSTRSPARPTPLGMSAVRLLSVHEDCLEVADIDVIDGTPLLDIKPYVPEFDSYPGSKAGWFDESNSQLQHADDRFQPENLPKR